MVDRLKSPSDGGVIGLKREKYFKHVLNGNAAKDCMTKHRWWWW
jgi:hypothetical protein